MTPEQQYLEMVAAQRMQTDPMARAVNDYGQGSGYMALDSQPESWDRLGEVNDIYRDVFGMTGIKMPQLVPGLNPEVEDPGQYQGFVSNMGSLYGSNPAFQEMEAALQEPGATVYEVIDLVAKNPRLQQFLPKNDAGQVDREAFNRDATMFLSERARENTERGAYDSQVAEFEDFTKPRTGLDYAPTRTDGPVLLDNAPQLRQGRTSLTAPVLDMADKVAEMIPLEAARRQRDAARKAAEGNPGSMTNPTGPGVNRSGNRLGMRVQDLRNESKARAARPEGAQDRDELVKLYNKAGSQAYNRTVANKEAKKAPSKQMENMAKVIQFYNMLHYGEV
jgi:hypothetical protein